MRQSNCKLHGGASTEKGTLQRKNRRFLTSTRPLEVFDVVPSVGDMAVTMP